MKGKVINIDKAISVTNTIIELTLEGLEAYHKFNPGDKVKVTIQFEDLEEEYRYEKFSASRAEGQGD